MIITDPKKLSMPQQVQKNKEDIEDIRKIIDGLDAEDNVVIVNDISQILTAEELEAIKQPVAFIVYNNHLYFKRSETSTTAYFDVVFSIVLSTVITLESSEIQVELSNGALGIVNSSVSTYSTTQIDNKFAEKTYVDTNFAKLSGADFTGEITAPSIIEQSLEYTFDIIPGRIPSGLTFNAVYAGVCKTGNKITLVLFAEIKRTASIDPGYIDFGLKFVLPRSVADRIYPYSLSGLDNVVDNINVSMFSSYSSSVSKPVIMLKSSDTNFFLNIYGLDTLTLDTKYCFRIETTFLLSDNLAQ